PDTRRHSHNPTRRQRERQKEAKRAPTGLFLFDSASAGKVIEADLHQCGVLHLQRQREPQFTKSDTEIRHSNQAERHRNTMTAATISMLLPLTLVLLLLHRPLPCLSFSAAGAGGGSTGAAHRVFISTPSKPTTKIVSDLMTSQPHLFVLSPQTPVDEAIAALLRAGVSGAPVVERLKDADTGRANDRLVGFVSSFDFLPREESGTLVTLGDDAGGGGEDAETARRILGRTVKDVMTRDPVTVTTNDLMKTAAETMARHRLHALPVVEAKHGNLVGIVTAKDVMRDVMKAASHALPSEEGYSQGSVPGDLAA
ncbi:hypothetical protein ACHAWF_002379, partial [Thalassiosira exigua]